MVTITILLLSAAFILCESTSLLKAFMDQFSASEPKLKTNGEPIPGVQEIKGDNGNNNERSQNLKIYENMNVARGLAASDMNDLKTLESFQGTDERVGETKGRSSCPSGWSNYGSRCFRFIYIARTWAKSEQFCVLQGGNLASIHSREEYYFIQVLVGVQTEGFPVTWIGGYDLGEKSLWLWSDGSRFDFTNWAKKEPSNGYGSCLQINYGRENLWDDTDCKKNLLCVF